MSFPELLEAIRRLPRAEKIRLMHELVDGLSTDDGLMGLPPRLLLQLPPNGTTIPVRTPATTDAAGLLTIEAALAERKVPS